MSVDSRNGRLVAVAGADDRLTGDRLTPDGGAPGAGRPGADPVEEQRRRRRRAEAAAEAAEEAAVEAAARASAAIAAAARAAVEAEIAADAAAEAATEADEAAAAERAALAFAGTPVDEPTAAVGMVRPAMPPPYRTSEPPRPAVPPSGRNGRPPTPGPRPPAGRPAVHRPPGTQAPVNGAPVNPFPVNQAPVNQAPVNQAPAARVAAPPAAVDAETMAIPVAPPRPDDADTPAVGGRAARRRAKESAAVEAVREPETRDDEPGGATAPRAGRAGGGAVRRVLRSTRAQLDSRTLLTGSAVGTVLAVAAVLGSVLGGSPAPSAAAPLPAASVAPAPADPSGAATEAPATTPSDAAADPESTKAVAYLAALRAAGVPTSASGQSETEAAVVICQQLAKGTAPADLVAALPAVLPTVSSRQAKSVVAAAQKTYC